MVAHFKVSEWPSSGGIGNVLPVCIMHSVLNIVNTQSHLGEKVKQQDPVFEERAK